MDQKGLSGVSPPHDNMSFIAMENAPADDFSKRENIAYLMIGGI